MKKIAIITGASSGIGNATAIALADRGVDSIVTFNRNEDGARRLSDEVRERGATAVPLRLEVGRTDLAGFRRSVASVLEDTWGAQRFDYLVNNAGFATMALFEDTTEALLDDLARVILKGPYLVTQALLPLIADGGAIVNVTSTSTGLSGMEPGYSAYASMKGGLTVLTRYMAKEFSRRGIRVNAVSPGATRTRLGDDAFEKYPEVIAPIVARTALNRLGEASDVGAVIAAVLSDEFRWVTGQEIEASGGHRL